MRSLTEKRSFGRVVELWRTDYRRLEQTPRVWTEKQDLPLLTLVVQMSQRLLESLRASPLARMGSSFGCFDPTMLLELSVLLLLNMSANGSQLSLSLCVDQTISPTECAFVSGQKMSSL